MRFLLIFFSGLCVWGQSVVSGHRYGRLIVRNAIIIEGNGTPASGPKDIVIENGRIASIVPLDPVAVGRGAAQRPQGDVEIDAAGKYVMPGLINAHAHVQEERGGIPQPLDYELKMWLACGITTVRDDGSNTPKTIQLREQSAAGAVVAPRIFVYPMFNQPSTPQNAEEARARIREYKAMGADGVHVGQDDLSVAEARKLAGGDVIVGKSTHSLEQAVAAEKEGPDYIGVGPIYATATKPDYVPVGPALIGQVRAAVRVPQFCIGGVNETTLPEVIAAGARRIVIVSALLQSADIPAYCRRVRALLPA